MGFFNAYIMEQAIQLFELFSKKIEFFFIKNKTLQMNFNSNWRELLEFLYGFKKT